MAITPIPSPNLGIVAATLYVTAGGNDSAGVRGRSDSPFATLNAGAAAASSGDTIIVGIGTFAPLTTTLPAYVRIEGSGRAHVDSTTAPTQLAGGTVIRGPLVMTAAGNAVRHVGIDCGSVVCAALYGGTAQDGLGIAGATLIDDVVVEDVTVLCKSATSLVHSILASNLRGATFRQLHLYYGVHGLALFGINCDVSDVYAVGHAWDGVIVKTVPGFPCDGNNIRGLYLGCVATGDSGGLFLQAGNSGDTDSVALAHNVIRDVQIVGTTFAVRCLTFAASVIDDMLLSGVVATGCTVGIELTGNTDRITLSDSFVSGASGAGVKTSTGNARTLIRGVRSTANGGDGFSLGGTQTYIADCTTQANAGHGYNAVSADVAGGTLTSQGDGSGDFTGNAILPRNPPSGTTAGTYALATVTVDAGGRVTAASATPVQGMIAPTFDGSWANLGDDVVGYYKDRGRCYLRGLATGGSGVIFTLPAGYRVRDLVVAYFPVAANGGLGLVAVDYLGDVSLVVGSPWVSLNGIDFLIEG